MFSVRKGNVFRTQNIYLIGKKLMIIILGEGLIFLCLLRKKSLVPRTLNLRDWIVDLRNKFNFGMFMES